MKLKDFNLDDWEECSSGEYSENFFNEEGFCRITIDGNPREHITLKKKQKFPIVFELSCERIIKVNENGTIYFYLDQDLQSFSISIFDDINEFEILEQAIKKSKELRGIK